MKTNALAPKVLHSVVVAISASLFCIETLVLAGIDVQSAFFELPAFLFLIFCTTLFSYSVGYIFPHPVNSIEVFYKNKFVFAISILAASASCIFLSRHYIEIFKLSFISVSVVVIVLSYYYLKDDETKLLKPHANLFVKNLSLVSVWGFTTVWLPLLLLQKDVFSSFSISLLMQRMLFVYALLIPFEIRDAERDRELNNKNLVHWLGNKFAKITAAFLLMAFCIIAYYTFSGNYQFKCLLTSSVISFLFIAFYNKDSKYHNQYLVIIDGMMLLQSLLVMTNILWQ